MHSKCLRSSRNALSRAVCSSRNKSSPLRVTATVTTRGVLSRNEPGAPSRLADRFYGLTLLSILRAKKNLSSGALRATPTVFEGVPSVGPRQILAANDKNGYARVAKFCSSRNSSGRVAHLTSPLERVTSGPQRKSGSDPTLNRVRPVFHWADRRSLWWPQIEPLRCAPRPV